MAEVFKRLIKLIETKFGDVAIDTKVSFLHYRVTSSLLLFCCALVSSYQYFGEPLQCIQSGTEDEASVSEHVLNNFCFITSTYTIVNDEEGSSRALSPKTHIRKHAYYQWIPSILFLQALMFTAPHTLWKYIDNGLLKGCLYVNNQLLDVKIRNSNVANLAKYIAMRRGSFITWGVWFYLTQILNTFNVLLNFVIIDYVLGGESVYYALQVVKYIRGNRTKSPFDNIFPKMTKCDFFKYGSSGSIQRHDALCLMTLNIVNEKIYSFLWIWLLILGFLSLISLCFVTWKVIIIAVKSKSIFLRQIYSLRNITPENVVLLRNLSLTDWIFLKQLQENVDNQTYSTLMNCLSVEILKFY